MIKEILGPISFFLSCYLDDHLWVKGDIKRLYQLDVSLYYNTKL